MSKQNNDLEYQGTRETSVVSNFVIKNHISQK